MATTAKTLYRAVQKTAFDAFVDGEVPADGVLYPRFVAASYVDGRGVTQTGRVDVRYNQRGDVKPGGGTSLHDVDGWFGFGAWRYFRIPKDTEIPASLKITGGTGDAESNRSGTRTGLHYQIEALAPMTVVAMQGALDNFMRNAVVKQVAAATTV